jgi:PIN domain nuclease of toxin-antitoxin system
MGSREVTFLDTHAAVFLYADHRQIPRQVWAVLDGEDLFLSPMAGLELDFLYEIGRITEDPRTILDSIERDYHVSLEHEGWIRAPEIARTLSWTRDPFDRLIVAHAITFGAYLLTRDERIRHNYRHAFWQNPPPEMEER